MARKPDPKYTEDLTAGDVLSRRIRQEHLWHKLHRLIRERAKPCHECESPHWPTPWIDCKESRSVEWSTPILKPINCELTLVELIDLYESLIVDTDVEATIAARAARIRALRSHSKSGGAAKAVAAAKRNQDLLKTWIGHRSEREAGGHPVDRRTLSAFAEKYRKGAGINGKTISAKSVKAILDAMPEARTPK